MKILVCLANDTLLIVFENYYFGPLVFAGLLTIVLTVVPEPYLTVVVIDLIFLTSIFGGILTVIYNYI